MSKKVFILTALAACFVLAVAPLTATERKSERSADRVQRGADRNDTEAGIDFVDTFAPQFLQYVGPVRAPSQGQLNVAVGQQQLGEAMKLRAAGRDDEAMRLLTRIATMEMVSTPAGNELLVTVHEGLAKMYPSSPARQVTHWNSALRYAADSNVRQNLEDRILAAGGVIVSDAAVLSSTASSGGGTVNDPGDDTCETAPAAVIPSEIQNISFPGDANWRFLDVVDPDGLGKIVSFTTLPTENTLSADTSVWLYSKGGGPCPGAEIGFDEDGGIGYMSQLDAGLLIPGTYYVEVRGWCPTAGFGEHCADPTDETLVGEYELLTTVLDVPTELPPDNYEPDDVPELANNIGHPTSTPLHANAWGRAKKDIQSHRVSTDMDIDWMTFKLTRTELVRVGTQGTYPTFFNDFDSAPVTIPGRSDPEDGIDRNVSYASDRTGCCWEEANILGENLPGGCEGTSYEFCVNGIGRSAAWIVRDNVQGVDTPSDAVICLPTTRGENTSASVEEGEDWLLSVAGAGSPADVFEYQARIKTEAPCAFEVEPNNAPGDENALTLGGPTVYGFFDVNAALPFQDADLYAFNVEQTSAVSFETVAANSLQSDTFLEIFVGPLGDPFPADTFLPTGLTNEDSGGTFLSRIEFPELPPASDLLDAFQLPQGENPRYLLKVTSNYFNPNFQYGLDTTIDPLPIPEIEPNDLSEEGSDWMSIIPGQLIDADVIEGCDMDTYRVALAESSYVRVSTAAGSLSDTILEMVDCQNGAVISNTCNDDGGVGLASSVEGCLSAGEHCFRIRAFSGSATGSYEFTVDEQATGCAAMDPPDMNSSGSNIGCSTNSCL